MRVLLDGYWWHEGPLSLRRVVRSIGSTWRSDFPNDDIGILVHAPSDVSKAHAVPQGIRVYTTRLRPQALAATVLLPTLGKCGKYDAILAQNYTPVFGDSAVLIHDVLFKSNPEWFTATERLYFAPMTILARRASATFTSTNSEARRISACTNVKPVVPVGLGVGDQLRVVSEARPSIQVATGEYLLTVGRLNVRKNLERTIEGALNSGVLSAEYPLVVVGAEDGRLPSLSPAARSALNSGSVKLLSRVNDAELRWLYANTAGFVYLSLDEGFGLPPLEARLFGCPVLVSDIGVFRETLASDSSDVCFVDPTNVDAIADGIRSLATADKPKHKKSRQVKGDHLEYNWHSVVNKLRQTMLRTSS